jgi:hypothetical protein
MKNEKETLIAVLEALGLHYEASLVRKRDYREAGAITYFWDVDPTDYRRWSTFVDALCVWSDSWVGSLLFRTIAEAELGSLDWRSVWIDLVWSESFALESLRFLVEPEVAKTIAADILRTGDTTELAILFDWRTSPQGFTAWYDAMRQGLDNYDLQRLLRQIID